MSSRFGRDPNRTSLFSAYNDRSTSPSKSKPHRSSAPSSRASPAYGYGYGASSPYGNGAGDTAGGPSFGAYPGSSSSGDMNGSASAGFRSATPNSRGQYGTAVLDELESQNEEVVGVLGGKIRELKHLTTLIGHEIRDSTALTEKMNDQFENSRLRIRNTMNRMLRMAERTGVGWKVWVGFFVCVALLFWWVWLF